MFLSFFGYGEIDVSLDHTEWLPFRRFQREVHKNHDEVRCWDSSVWRKNINSCACRLQLISFVCFDQVVSFSNRRKLKLAFCISERLGDGSHIRLRDQSYVYISELRAARTYAAFNLMKRLRLS